MEAQKVILNGCPNLWKVSDRLYRSAQPNKIGFKGLWTLGIRSVINLRTMHYDSLYADSKDFILHRYPMACWHPEIEDVISCLIIINDFLDPVLIHCKHGSDRTGSMVALYRIIIEGWSKEDALKEMQLPQFGFHPVWENLIDWIEGIDIDKIKIQLKEKKP